MNKKIIMFAIIFFMSGAVNAYQFTSNTCIVTTLWPEHEWIWLDDEWSLQVREEQQWSKVVNMLWVLERIFPKYFKGTNEEKIEFIINVQNTISKKNDTLKEKAYWDVNDIYTEQPYDQDANTYLRNLKVLSFFLNKKLLEFWYEKQYYTPENWNLCTQ